MMASFADLIDEIDRRYSPGPKAPQLVQETYHWVMEQPGGAEGLLEKCSAAGLAAEVASWTDGLAPVPLSGQEVEQTLGSETLGAFAETTGLNPNFVRTILGYALPEIIMLAKSGAVPPEIPASDAETPDPAVPLSPSPAETFSPENTAPMQAGDRIFLPAPAPRAPPRFKKFATSGSVLALALFGLAWAGWHFSGGPASRESAGRTETHMAEDISGPQSQRRGVARRAEPVADRRHHACRSEDRGSMRRKAKRRRRSQTLRGRSRSYGIRRRKSRNFPSGWIALNIRSRGPLPRHPAPPRCKAPRAAGSRRKWPPRCPGRQPSTRPKIPAAQDRAETGRN